jgi:phosphatidylserine decarboxylase
MTIHKEGRLFLLITALVMIGLNVALYYLLPTIAFGLFFATCIVFYILFAQFFRSPSRRLTIDEKSVICPADGKVVVIEKVFENEYLKDERIQVSIFMSPLNVHLNRVPITGKLEYYKYHPGLYMVAFHPKSSELNERNTAVITNINGTKILMRQIAGAVARRIRFYLKEGQAVKQGEELGFIKFGSRVDVFLPLNAEIKVELNQLTKGGVTVLANLK